MLAAGGPAWMAGRGTGGTGGMGGWAERTADEQAETPLHMLAQYVSLQRIRRHGRRPLSRLINNFRPAYQQIRLKFS
jgi:hypothetical protein